MREAGEESEHKGNKEIYDRDAINPDAIFAESEAGGKEGLITVSLEPHTSDGDNVRGQESARSERGNGVECDGTSNINKRKQDRKAKRNEDGVKGNIPPRLNIGQEFAKWDPVITGKGKELARRGCDVIYAAKDSHCAGDGG